MCDYSLQAIKSRSATVGDKLVVHSFGLGTTGFADSNAAAPDTAICLLPGTEIAIDPVVPSNGFVHKALDAIGVTAEPRAKEYCVAIFRQINKDNAHTHHDMLEFPNGDTCMLTYMPLGLKATVLQLPAAPKNETEREEQTRAAFV